MDWVWYEYSNTFPPCFICSNSGYLVCGCWSCSVLNRVSGCSSVLSEGQLLFSFTGSPHALRLSLCTSCWGWKLLYSFYDVLNKCIWKALAALIHIWLVLLNRLTDCFAVFTSVSNKHSAAVHLLLHLLFSFVYLHIWEE